MRFANFTSRVLALAIGSPLIAALLLCTASGSADAQARRIIVNGSVLDAGTQRALERAYRTPLRDGRYWYDGRSGLWGLVGGPSQGQIAPGLALGRLDPRASVGANAGITGVYVNGREIHPIELAQLQRMFGSVRRARYWLDARGIGGYEGGPPQWNLTAISQRGGGGGGYVRRGPGGNTGSDGSCSYYNDPTTGASVMTGRC